MRAILILAAVACLVAAPCSAQQAQKSAVGAYVLSIFVGFGSGHFYVGSPRAPVFLGVELGAVGAVVVGGVHIGTSMLSLNVGTAVLGYSLIVAGSAVLPVARIVEIISTIGEVDRKRQEGTVAIVPTITAGPRGALVGVSLRY